MTDTAQTIVQKDLEYIASTLKVEFGRMGGKRLLVVGGAGFLGYYREHLLVGDQFGPPILRGGRFQE